MKWGVWVKWPKTGWYSDEPVRDDLPRRLLLKDGFQVCNGEVVTYNSKEEAEGWAKVCREDRAGIGRHGGGYSVKEVE